MSITVRADVVDDAAFRRVNGIEGYLTRQAAIAAHTHETHRIGYGDQQHASRVYASI